MDDVTTTGAADDARRGSTADDGRGEDEPGSTERPDGRVGQDVHAGLVSPEMLTDDRRLSAPDPGPAPAEDLLGEPPGTSGAPSHVADVEGDVPRETERAREVAPGQEFSGGEG